jgi:hypothetical protein
MYALVPLDEATATVSQVRLTLGGWMGSSSVGHAGKAIQPCGHSTVVRSPHSAIMDAWRVLGPSRLVRLGSLPAAVKKKKAANCDFFSVRGLDKIGGKEDPPQCPPDTDRLL